MMKKRIIQVIFAAVIVIMLGTAGFMGLRALSGRGQETSTDENTVETQVDESVEETSQEGDDGSYITADPYRESRADEKILPETVEVSDGDGNVYLIEEYDSNARYLMNGDYGETGISPSAVYVLLDGEKVLAERYTYEYNDDGMIIKESCYSDTDLYDGVEDVELSSTSEYTYYSGQLAKEVYSVYDSSGSGQSVTTIEWTYDDNGYAVRRDYYFGSLLSYYEEITCNSNGSPVEMRQYTYNGVLSGVKVYTYTETGDFLRYEEYFGDMESLNASTEYIYDDKDYLREIIVENYYTEDGVTETSYEVHTYIYPEDVQGRLGDLD